MDKSELFEKMYKSVMEGDRDAAEEAAKDALRMKIDPREAIEKGYTPAIKEVGELWEEGEYFLPEVVVAAEAMKSGIAVLKPELEKQNDSVSSLGTVVIGTIEGDIHDIGKSLVGALLAASGFLVHDLGFDVPVDTFVNEVKAKDADIVGISALLTTTMTGQKKVIDKLTAEGIRSKVKVLVGGAPVSKKWAEEIGADAAPMSAIEAVQSARELVKVKA